MTSFEQQIEEDLTWRETEMATLKLLLASAPTGSPRQQALLRACCAMLYAHYEGFCKFCWVLMLDTIQAEACFRRDLVEPVAVRSMATIFKRLRGNAADESLWRFARSEFCAHLQQPATFPEEVDTGSNLWPTVSKEINGSLGLQCPLLLAHKSELGQLVSRRNRIAHGEKLEIADLRQFQRFEHAAVLVMHELAIAVTDCLEKKTYLRSVGAPAPLT